MKLVVVTGANRGLGKTYVERLLRDSETWKIVMTARDSVHGQQVRDEIAEATNAQDRLLFQQLDITNSDSVAAFKEYVAAELGAIDVLVNNAGLYDKSNPTATLLINFEKTTEFTDIMLPFLKPTGHIIVIASTLGKKQYISGEAIKAAAFAEDLSRDQLNEMYRRCVAAHAEGQAEAEGWNADSYFNSKFLLNAYVRLVAKELKASHSQVRINAMCPGWCSTEMGGPNATRTAEEGVQTYIHLTKLEADVSGEFWYDSAIASF